MTLDPDLQRLADHADRLNGDAVRALIARVQGYRDGVSKVNTAIYIAQYEQEGCPDEVDMSHDHPFGEPIAYYLKEDKP